MPSLHEALTRERFDSWAQSWSYRRLRQWLEYVQRRVLDSIEWSEVTAFLDVACGSGWATLEAARSMEHNGRGTAYGCDISTGMLAHGVREEVGDARVFFSVASAQVLPFSNDVFDVAICTAAFHHFPAPLSALREIKRVLRPGGKLLIADTCRDQSVGTWVWDRLHRWFEPGHVKYYRGDELLELMSAAGFAGEEMAELCPPYEQTRKVVRSISLFQARAV